MILLVNNNFSNLKLRLEVIVKLKKIEYGKELHGYLYFYISF